MRTAAPRALSAAAILVCAGLAQAQTCQPQWDTTIGTIGITGGYAAPIRGWNSGTGEQLYVGGSFSGAGNVGATGLIGRWNPTTNTWSALGSGVSTGSTNGFMTSLLPFNPGTGERLVVGGFYDTAGGVPNSASLAMWNGTSWAAMGTGWTGTTRQSVWAMATFGGLLYVGGGIVNTPAQIAGQPWAGMASWDGTRWTPTISALGGGFSPYIAAMTVFNDGSGDALYVAGRFTSIEGVPGTSGIARWNGTTWSSVGGGLNSTSTLFGPEGLTVFDNGQGPALYVGGYTFTAAGMGASNVAKWNGSAWSSVGGALGTGRITCITGFDDGAGPKLYIGGTAMPQFNYIARWEGSSWVAVGGGVTGPGLPPSNFPSVFGMGISQGKLYAGGNFAQVNNMNANGLAAWTSCTSACYANCDGSTVAPILNVNDFVCFQTKYAQGDTAANCDGSTTQPILNVNDFICFQTKYAQGCP